MSTTTNARTAAAALAVAARLADAPAHTITVHRYGGDGDAGVRLNGEAEERLDEWAVENGYQPVEEYDHDGTHWVVYRQVVDGVTVEVAVSAEAGAR